MPLCENLLQPVRLGRAALNTCRVASWSATVVLLATACGDPSGPGGGDPTATLSGTVRVAVTQQVVEGAKITFGARQATTNASGQFEITGVAVGSGTVRAERSGFLPAEAQVMLSAGSNTHNFTLTPATTTASLSGTVRAAVTQQALDGAKITLGTSEVITDANGRFEFTGVAVGNATVKAERAGYSTMEASATLSAGSNTLNFTLSPLVQEVFVIGSDAAYVPDGVGPLRGAIIVLGGPITSGFVTGQRIAPIGKDVLEASLQNLGTGLRGLAKSARVALIGRTQVGMPNNEISDEVLFALLEEFSGASGHAELADRPVLLFGLSSGSHEAGGFVSRHPDRAIGLLLRVPTGALDLTSASTLAVPTLVIQGGADVVANNTLVQTIFTGNRSRGGLWSLVVEPDVAHDVATALANSAAIDWLSEALSRRLPATPGNPLVALSEPSGWLGNQATREIASWAAYTGDRTTASWLLSSAIAASWQQLGTPQ